MSVSNAIHGDEKFRSVLLRSLDILIALQLDNVPSARTATNSKIERLLSAGASPAEAARIISKPINYVTATIAMRNKRKKGGRTGRSVEE